MGATSPRADPGALHGVRAAVKAGAPRWHSWRSLPDDPGVASAVGVSLLDADPAVAREVAGVVVNFGFGVRPSC